MKDRNKLTFYQIILGILMALVLLAGALIGMFFYNNYRELGFYGEARVFVADAVSEIEKAVTDSGFNEQNYSPLGDAPVVIIKGGAVIYSENADFTVEKNVSLNEFLQLDVSDKAHCKITFSVGNDCFAAFFVNKDALAGVDTEAIPVMIFLPVFIAIAVCALLYTFNALYLKRRVIAPVNEMLLSTRAIIDGDLSVPVVKNHGNDVYDNDVEKLAYNFELMRAELEEQKQRESSLRKTQKELISCISHDLKTPIATIRAYSEGLRDGMAKNPEQAQKYSSIIVEKTDILTKMITDLLDHSNAELNQLKITMKEQYFGDFINALAAELRGLVEHAGFEFIYENSGDNLLINFDANRITQVISNLVDNAIKYGKKSGGRIEMSVYEESGRIAVSVKDNGIGIDASDIPFVFDKFYRGEKSRSTKIAGSGLGLSICKYIVEAHGGEMKFDSLSESGSTFFVYLPIC